MISVIVPVLNAEDTLDEQLAALARQTYRGSWELVIADNGSTDRSLSIARGWGHRIPGMRIVDASSRRGAAGARNMGAEAARGEAFAFCDADDVVTPEWLASLAAALESDEFVTGSIDRKTLNKDDRALRGPLAIGEKMRRSLRFLPYAQSGNMAVTRSAFERVGGFAEDLGTVGEDVDISWRLQLMGHQLVYEPRAKVAVRFRYDLRQVARQQFEYGRSQTARYKRFRAHGVTRQAGSPSRAFREYAILVVSVPLLLDKSFRPRWVRRASMRAGRARQALRDRVLFL